MGGSRGRGAGGPDLLKNHNNIGFLSNTGLNPLKMAFAGGPMMAR